jgi:hypothetical protein
VVEAELAAAAQELREGVVAALQSANYSSSLMLSVQLARLLLQHVLLIGSGRASHADDATGR